MFRMKRLILPMLMLGVVSCNDTSGPATPEGPESASRMTLNHLRWNETPSFSATAGSAFGDVPLAEPEYWAMLQTNAGEYAVSFWAVRGEYRYVDIYYDDVDSTQYSTNDGQYLKLEITDPTALADSTPIAVGDSVLITVTVNSQTLVADLQPSGIQFGTTDPTVLTMWYSGADPDYDADTDVDAQDSNIETNLLGMWVQTDVADPWDSLSASHSQPTKKFVGSLEHFSGYAISW